MVRRSLLIYFLMFASAIGFLSSCGIKDYPSSSRPISHSIWDSLLQQHVSPAGKVDYQGFQKDSIRFNRYLTLLKNNHPNKKNWSKEEQLAYWINAYNAFTIQIVLEHYPLQSIKDIKKGIPFINSVWDIKFIQIEGATYDLNNIEHGIIRKQFEEPRIHFAVNCASVSCPKLLNKAYTAEKLEDQLTKATKDFLTDREKNIIDSMAPQLSKIFSWYRMDFKAHGTVIDFINQYSDIKINRNAKINYLEYDWNLNGA